MINEIEEQYEFPNSIIKKQHIDIGAELPDVDFALYDKTTNSAIFCEMKWLTEADSPQEVFAREEDVEHGFKLNKGNSLPYLVDLIEERL